MPIRALNPGNFFKASHSTAVVYVVITAQASIFPPQFLLSRSEFESRSSSKDLKDYENMPGGN